MNKLFFELIRVAIGNAECLSHTPSAKEWQMLYEMAKKQSLVGICFAGVQKLQSQRQTPPELLYLQWMGMAAKIQQRNETLDRQCAELQKLLEGNGTRSCILKGQGVALLYDEKLRGLRQCGDIDVWILPQNGKCDNSHFLRVISFAKSIAPIGDFNLQHVSVSMFDNTEVELHFVPSMLYSPSLNRKLQRWFEMMALSENTTFSDDCGFNVPSVEFNIVYLLQHCYNHLLFEGVGLRQIMDYYFVLRSVSDGFKFQMVSSTLKDLGLQKFAGALMWVLREVFRLEVQYMIVEQNARDGKFLLNEIMSGGNFGKYNNDKVSESRGKSGVKYFIARIKRSCKMISFAPAEVLSLPWFMAYHYIKKRIVFTKYIEI